MPRDARAARQVRPRLRSEEATEETMLRLSPLRPLPLSARPGHHAVRRAYVLVRPQNAKQRMCPVSRVLVNPPRPSHLPSRGTCGSRLLEVVSRALSAPSVVGADRWIFSFILFVVCFVVGWNRGAPVTPTTRNATPERDVRCACGAGAPCAVYYYCVLLPCIVVVYHYWSGRAPRLHACACAVVVP